LARSDVPGASGSAIPAAPPAFEGASSARSWLWPHVEELIAGLSFATAVKALCMAGNVLVQVSPYPQVKRWEQRGCTGEVDAAPYVSIAFGGWQWCCYGLFAWMVTKRSGFLILVQSNCLGAVLGTYYTMVFFRNCRHKEASLSLQWYMSAVGSLVLLQMCSILALPLERALFLTGLVASFCSFVGALSMLVVVPTVLRTGDSRAVSGPLVVTYLFSSMVWCVCGWLLGDPLIAAPNVAALISCSICAYLKMSYPSDVQDTYLQSDEQARSTSKFEVAVPKKLPTELTPLVLAATGIGASALSDATGGTC